MRKFLPSGPRRAAQTADKMTNPLLYLMTMLIGGTT